MWALSFAFRLQKHLVNLLSNSAISARSALTLDPWITKSSVSVSNTYKSAEARWRIGTSWKGSSGSSKPSDDSWSSTVMSSGLAAVFRVSCSSVYFSAWSCSSVASSCERKYFYALVSATLDNDKIVLCVPAQTCNVGEWARTVSSWLWEQTISLSQ